MAAEEIKLVGVFRDEITPKLKKLNKEINTVTKSFGRMRRKLQPIARDFEKIAVAVDRVGTGLSRQNAELRTATTTMSKYRTQVRRTASEQRKLKPMRGGGMGGGRAPRGGGAAGGGGGLGGVGAGFATAGITIGNQFGAMVMQGMRQAFDMYRGILLKPFQFLASGIQERIDDEMDDIKTAGGLFSISKRSENPFIDNFQQAEALTKETNRYLAELAGALPGDTQQYISVSRQISDGIYQILSNDKEGSLGLAQKIAQQNGRELNYEGMSQPKQIQMAGKELVGEMTKLTVLGSMGQRQGAMGLPQLVEQMMSQDQVSSGQFRRYAAIFRDPLVKGALERNIPKINQAGKNTADRLEALQETLNEVVTPELVRRYQRSTAGVIEEMKTIFLNPEVGMLGLGKPLKQSVKSFNQFGEELYTLEKEITIGGKVLEKGAMVTARQLKAAGVAIEGTATAAYENIAIFDYVRDIFGNLAVVFSPIIQAAAGMFTGFDDLASALNNIRNFTMKLQNSFEQYRVGLEALGENFGSTVGLRAALGAVNNLFANLGVISDADFMSNALNLKDANFSAFPEMIADLMTTFLQSTAAIDFGAAIGKVFGSILSSFAGMIEGIADPSKVENIFTGFMKGFKGKDGIKAMKTILNALVSSIVKILGFIVTNFPMESLMVALAALAPALISGLIAGIPGIIGAIAGGLGGGAGIGAAIATGFSAILASPALLAAIIGGLAITAKATEGPRKALTESLASSAQRRTDSVRGDDGQLRSLTGNGLAGVMDGLMGELTWVVHDFIKGFGDIFTGLYNIVAGLLTNPELIGEGITQVTTGLFSLFTMIGHALIAIGYAVPGLIMGVLVAIKNLFVGIGHAIIGAWMNTDWTNKLGNDIRYLFNSIGQAITNAAGEVADWGSRLATSISNFFSGMMTAITNAARSIPVIGGLIPKAESEPKYNGGGAGKMSLGSAIATENKMKPPGSHLVIANSSETVIPAYKGYVPSFASSAPQAMATPALTGYGSTPPSKEVNIGGITVNVTGNENATEIAEQVAQEIVYAIQKSTYNELYTT